MISKDKFSIFYHQEAFVCCALKKMYFK